MDLRPPTTEFRFLALCADDFTSLDFAFGLARTVARKATFVAQQNEVGRVVGGLVRDGLVRVGEMRSDEPGLVYWRGSTVELEQRFLSYLMRLSEPLDPGMNLWFDATEAGRRMVSDVLRLAEQNDA